MKQTTNYECNWSTPTNKRPEFKLPVRSRSQINHGRRETAMATHTAVTSSSKNTNSYTTKPYAPACILCQELHFLNQCKRFRNFSFDDRRKFVNDKRLCRCCLEQGHFANNCKRTNPCTKSECTARHATLLHPPDTPALEFQLLTTQTTQQTHPKGWK